MKPIKIIHLSDVQFSRENQGNALLALNTVLETAEKEKPDLFVISGDLFDRSVNNTSSSGFPDLIGSIKLMMDIAPVVAVRGTPTHDLYGCYDVFQEIRASNNFILLQPNEKYFLSRHYRAIGTEEDFKSFHDWEPYLLILGCPEPSKEWFLKDKQLGKAESDEAIKEGMRSLLLGMGALRKQYPDIPCVLVYHGSVAGATLSNSQLLPAGGIQIGRDDLALVGADYYALGHIHLVQQIGNLPAYYAGSAFPVDWGELDQKRFNIVEINEDVAEIPGEHWYQTEVKRIAFPFPPRKKIVTDWPLSDNLGEIEGYDVWLQIRATKEDRHLIDIEKIGNKLRQYGARFSSRIDVILKPTETIRAYLITEASKLRDKVKIYADLSNEKVTESILEKADKIEEAARESGEIPEGLHIRLKKLILRGAIGIHKGTGKDQVEIDFEEYETGLIVLVGVNGAGKTTLIENMHPYTQMLTRPGKLQDHFYLKDSFRDLYFIDERSGVEYRAFMQIDGVNKSGSVEYFLWKIEGGAFIPVNDEINGRKEAYVTEIERLFGSLQLYLRSAFISQKQPKNLPDLADATKGEKKALFRELGGLDYLQTYSDMAKENAKGLNNKLISTEAKLEGIAGLDNDIKTAKESLENLREEKIITVEELQHIKEKGKKISTEKDALEKKVEKNKEYRSQLENVNGQIRKFNTEKVQIVASLDGYQQALKGKEKAEKDLTEYANLKKEEAKLNDERTKILKKRETLLDEYRNKKDAVSAHERKIVTEKAEKERGAAEANREHDVLEAEANNLEKEIQQNPITENCPTCGQKWPADRLDLFKDERKIKELSLSGLKKQIFEIDKKIVALLKAITAIDETAAALKWPKEPDLPFFDEARFNDVISILNHFDPDYCRKIITEAEQAEVRIEEGNKRIAQIDKELNELLEKAADLLHVIDEEIDIAYAEVSERLEETRWEYTEKDKVLTRITATIDHIAKQIVDLNKKRDDLKELQVEADRMKQKIAEWEYLQRACGPDGIQALELDAMGPGIAEVTNSILESAYGSRFQIEFKTTRIGGSGSNTRQIEDFQILINDSETGDEQLLETLSGGESVWIKNAIYSAFGIIRGRKTGTKFLTVFMDEADGALDPEARQHYFRMIGKAHQEAGRHQTIVITHSPEAQEVIGQKIEMKELKESTLEKVLF